MLSLGYINYISVPIVCFSCNKLGFSCNKYIKNTGIELSFYNLICHLFFWSVGGVSMEVQKPFCPHSILSSVQEPELNVYGK